MSSEAITRNDLTAILNEVLPFSFTEFRHHTGTTTVPNSTLVQVHSETFESGSWLILTTIETLTGGSGTVNLGQNRILENSTLVYAHKEAADISVVNTNFYVLQSASNTTITLESYQTTGNSQSQEWTFTAIRIGDKFAQGEADYIVEQGTSGIWTYRKWNSGIAECWGMQAYENLAMTSAEGSGYYAPLKTISFPSGLFTATPVVTIGVHEGGALGNFTIGSLTTAQVSGYFWATRSVTKGVTLFIRVEGKWK